jgi:hypothetical protein
MDLDDEYDLASERWIAAVFKWANEGCPDSGYEYDSLNRLDLRLQKVASDYVEAKSDLYEGR